MFCPNCARENPDRNKFCNGCGASLQVELAHSQPLAPPPPPKVSKPPINSFVSAETNEQRIKDFVRPKTVENNVSAENPIKAEKVESLFPMDATNQDKASYQENLSKVFEDAESLLDDIFAEEKSSNKPKEVPVSETTAQIIDLHHEQPTKDNFHDYFSEVKNKYQPSENPRKNKNTHFIVGVSAVTALIIVGGFIGLGWHFMRQSSNSAETSVVNKTPVIVKANTNQPPAGMVYVIGREFMMGSDGGDEYARPAHRVTVKPFYIDKTEVTCEDYKKFVDDAGYAPPPTWQNSNCPSGSAQKPVTGVNWDDANAYAKWKGKRLPTEEEWEFAARGTDERIYPWGNVWKPEMANADKQKDSVEEVGTFNGQSPFGCFDMSGNAWEWTSSEAKAYTNGKPFETESVQPKVLRGGYFGTQKELATTTLRRPYGARNEAKGYNNTSFRCVLDVSQNIAEKSDEEKNK